MRLFCFALMVCLTTSAFAWDVRFEPRVKTYGNGASRNYDVLVVDGGDYVVDFVPYTFWTVHEIVYKGHKVNQSSGATGTVIHWDGEAIGTGHRGKERAEELDDVILTVDGKAHDLVVDGKRVADGEFTASGRDLSLLKRSTIGPLAHEAQFDFDPAGNCYIATHRFKVIQQITPERFKGYRYVFMQMMPKDISLWVRYGEDGSVAEGEMSRPEPGGKRKQTFVFNQEPMKALACFSPDNGVGIAYVYPKQYAGTNHYLDRYWKDNKFRSILFEKDSYAVDEEMTWKMRVEPFTATMAAWKDAARKVVDAPWP